MNSNSNLNKIKQESTKITTRITDKIQKAKVNFTVWVNWVNEGLKHEKKSKMEEKLENKGYIIYEKGVYKNHILCKKQIQKTYPYKREFAVYDLKKSELLKFENGMLAKQYIEKEENTNIDTQSENTKSDNIEIEFNK